MAFSTVVAFNRFPERASIHTVAFHRLALVGRGNNLGGFSQYDHLNSLAQIKNNHNSNLEIHAIKIKLNFFSLLNIL